MLKGWILMVVGSGKARSSDVYSAIAMTTPYFAPPFARPFETLHLLKPPPPLFHTAVSQNNEVLLSASLSAASNLTATYLSALCRNKADAIVNGAIEYGSELERPNIVT